MEAKQEEGPVSAVAVPVERPDLGISDSEQSERSTTRDPLAVREELVDEGPGQLTTRTDQCDSNLQAIKSNL